MTHLSAHQSALSFFFYMFLFKVGICHPFGKRLFYRKMVFYIFEGPFSTVGNIGPSSFVVRTGQTPHSAPDESLVGKKLPLKTISKVELDGLQKLKHIFNSNNIQQ